MTDEPPPAWNDRDIELWARRHCWLYAPLVRAAEMYRDPLEYLAAEENGDLAAANRAREAGIGKSRDRQRPHLAEADWWRDVEGAREHFAAAVAAFPGLTFQGLEQALSAAGRSDLEQRVDEALEILNEPFWPYALAVAWLALEGDVARLRSGAAANLEDGFGSEPFDDSACSRLGIAVDMFMYFAVDAAMTDAAQRRLARALRSGRVTSWGVVAGGTGERRELRAFEWIDLTPRFDGEATLWFRGVRTESLQVGDVRFDATMVRALVDDLDAHAAADAVRAEEPPASRGGPTSYQEFQDLVRESLEMGSENGRNDKLRAAEAGVAPSTFSGWKKKYRRLNNLPDR